MTTRILAANATLDSIKKQAKSLLKAAQAADSSALARLKPYFDDPADIGLQSIQLVVAREYGFSSWTKLKLHLEKTGTAGLSVDQLANQFLSLATVSYFSHIPADPARFEEAARLIVTHTEIAEDSIHVAAAMGEGKRVAAWLDRQPQLLEHRGGPFDWQPLLYAAYGRLTGRSSLDAARELIRRGADPNAFFLDAGQYRFTALTGVFGEGEAGKVRQPPHPEYLAFARLLLDAGAEPNDSQALYNRMFELDNSCLELLLRYGLNASDRNNWLVREDGHFVENSQTVFDYQLAWALQNRMPERVRLLVEHGADVVRPVDGRTPFEWAQLGGDRDLAMYLVRHGAVAVRLKPEDQAYAAIMNSDDAFDIGQVEALADGRSIQKAHPAMLHEAAGNNALEHVRRMLALGFDVNAMTSRTPLHEAALHGHLDMAKLLIEHGADPTIRDPHYYAPPIGWADYNGQTEMVAFLEAQRLDIFAAAAYGALDEIERALDADPSLLQRRFGNFRSPGTSSPDRDWMTPLGFAILNGRLEAVRLLVERGADRSVRDEAGRSYRDLARDGRDADIIALLNNGPPSGA